MLIGKEFLPEKNIVTLINDIKKKKELQNLSEDFIRDHLFNYLKQEKKSRELISKEINRKSTNYKKIIKELRSKLRRVYGLFRTEEETKKRRQLIEKLLFLLSNKNNEKDIEKIKEGIIKEILKTHSSTRERLPFYKKLYSEIFKITNKPKTIIDLGSGINPFSYKFMKLKKLNYYSYDLNEEEVESINQYFKHLNNKNKDICVKAKILNILSWNKLKLLKEADLCLMFKMTDVLDKGKGHKVSENVINKIPAKFIIVSFPTLTISGKKMNFPRRRWIELMCKRLNYKFHVLNYPNEIFYIIKK